MTVTYLLRVWRDRLSLIAVKGRDAGSAVGKRQDNRLGTVRGIHAALLGVFLRFNLDAAARIYLVAPSRIKGSAF
jgi:hypothetical protein